MKRLTLIVAIAAALAAAAVIPLGQGAVGSDSEALRAALTVGGIQTHLQALQQAADDGGGSRDEHFAGFQNTVDYVVETLESYGYTPAIQPFSFDAYVVDAPPLLEQLSPNAKTYQPGTDVVTMEFSGTVERSGELVPTNDIVIPPGPVEGSSNSGCEAPDFPAAVSGKIALIQRGTCTFRQKLTNAQAAGAIGVVLFNEGQPGRTDAFEGTLDPPLSTIPVVMASFAVGAELYSATQAGTVTVRVGTAGHIETVPSVNVIADTSGGRADRTVVVGGHLDSVPAGPGINDDGSGISTILEIAHQFSVLGIEPTNRVRFAFFGAEEEGLLGSEYYAAHLTARQLKDIAVMLDYDMLASPNFVRFVYDGDGSAGGPKGPSGSGNVEKIFNDYFASQGLATSPTPFDGRSDYVAFTDRGIPAGGIFAGAEGRKTVAEQAIYGGTAGVAYDPCYHAACDDISNPLPQALDEFGDAAADAVFQFAMTTSAVNGSGKASSSSSKYEFKGSKRIR
jgi:Zn-dependent M28 family amino/carboxypeptidase